MARVAFAAGVSRFMPFIGYHHFLMILIALAIILLCKFNSPLLSKTLIDSVYCPLRIRTIDTPNHAHN